MNSSENVLLILIVCHKVLTVKNHSADGCWLDSEALKKSNLTVVAASNGFLLVRGCAIKFVFHPLIDRGLNLPKRQVTTPRCPKSFVKTLRQIRVRHFFLTRESKNS